MENRILTDRQVAPGTLGKLTSHHFSAILSAKDGGENCSAEDLLRVLKESIVEAQLTAVAEVTAQFQPQGNSAVVVLEESHVAIHMWPEHRAATVDIHVCDYSGDNETKAMQLARSIGLRVAGDDSLDRWSRLTVTQ